MHKKRLLPLLLAIISLVMIIGGSYAVWNYNFIGNSNTISTADMSIEFLESNSNIITVENALPMGDNDGKSQETTFDFSVTSRTPKNAVFGYILSIEKLAVDNDATALNDNDIKVYLTDYSDNELVEPTLISELDNYKLYSNLHRHNNTNRDIQDKYKLRVWVNPENVNVFNWNSSTKYQYKFKINVSSSETTPLTVNTVVSGGTITGSTSKEVMNGGSVKFETSPNETYSETSVSCTNSQNGTIKNGKLVVTNVTSNTICTITYAPSKTVLYTDGTLIINEKASDRSQNITTHGAVINEYQAMSNLNNYVFNQSNPRPWNSQKNNITRVEIGQKIQPTNTKNWFFALTKMSYGDFTNLDTSNVTDMSSMFDNVGYDSNVTSFSLIGLDNWDTSKVTDMNNMFNRVGYYATNFELELSSWDTSSITNMSHMFSNAGYSATNFELELSSWDTSNVSDMYQMFYYAGYNATTWSIGSLSNWVISKVTNMEGMFQVAGYSAITWNIGNLSNWDVSNVTNMDSMFYSAGYNATTWNIGDLSNWDTSHVTDMGYMFSSAGRNATSFELDLSNWNTSKVTNMSNMFYYAGENVASFNIGNLSNWDTSDVISMNSMFAGSGYYATTWNSIGTLKVYATDIYRMFFNSVNAKATLNIYSNPSSGSSGYNNAFYGAATADDALIVVNGSCTTTNIDDIIATKSSNSHVIKGIQFGCGTDTEYPVTLDAQGGTIPSSAGWTLLNDGGVAAKNYVESTTIGTLPTPTYRNYEFLGWYTKQEGGTKVTSSTNIDKSMTLYAHFSIPSWNVSISVNNGTVSGDTYKIVKDYTSPTFNVSTTLEGDYVSSVTCTNGQHGAVNNGVATIYNVTNNTSCTVEYSDAGSTVLYTDGTLIINEKASDREANITSHGVVTNEYAAMSNSNNYVFSGDTSQPWNSQKSSITRVEIGQKIQPINTQRWFYGLTNMSYGDFTNLDTSQSTSFLRMFYQTGYNSSVTSFELVGLNNWDTSKVTSMANVFYRTGYYATTWSIGNLSNLNTSNVTNMNSMFSNAGYNATTWSIGDLSNWNISSVTNMYFMFSNAGRSATTWNIGNLSNWDTSEVTNMSSMFGGAAYNAIIFDIGNLSNWNTSNVTNMNSMFSNAGYNATTWSIGDLSNWDTSNVTDMTYMFNCAGYKATTWNIGDLSDWDTSRVTTMSGMFKETGNNVTTWNNIGTLNVYANDIGLMFREARSANVTLNIINVPTVYSDVFTNAATTTGSQISVNYNCTTAGVVNDILATKSTNSNVVLGTNLEGTCPDRTIDVVVNNGTVNTSSTTVPNLGSATFNLTPTSGYSNPLVSCTNGQTGTLSGNTLTVSNVVSDTTCTVTYYISEAITLTENDATYPWIETSGVWKSGNYNVNSSTSTITSSSFTLTSSGIVSFDWAVSSESASYDYLYYTIYKDGTAVSGTGTSTKIGGNGSVVDEANLSYTTVSKELEAGTYTIAFSYRKDGSQHTGLDRGYVKNIFVLK